LAVPSSLGTGVPSTYTMKSFRLYRQPSPSIPAQLATDLSPGERTRLQQAFRTAAASYRHRQRMCSYALFGFFGWGVAFMFFGGVLHVAWVRWLFVPAMICWMVFFGLPITAPTMACPSCGNDMEHRFGRYCPECGADGLQRAPWLPNNECISCGKTLRHHKGRHYKIRACTHCGLWLDEDGL
jgi:predicted RNA-binding Zn-ribbon protein involved in translation (DUF1610 family)